MTDIERITSIFESVEPFLRNFFSTPECLFWREPLDGIRTRCWYESLKQRFAFSGPAEMERHLEPDAVKWHADGRFNYSSNKWPRFRDGSPPGARTLEKVEKNAPGSMRIFYHPLWDVLDFDNKDVMEGQALLRRLSTEVQAVLFRSERIGIFSYVRRAPVNRSLLKKLELMADLDVLACLTWLLREAVENKCSGVQAIGRSLHKVLTMMALELHALKIGLPLLQRFIDLVLPLALPRHHRIASTPLDYICDSGVLNELSFNIKGEPKTLDWKRRVKNMERLLEGWRGVDVQFALGLRTALDDKHPWVPFNVVKEIKSFAFMRNYGWAEILFKSQDGPGCCRGLRMSYMWSRIAFSDPRLLRFQPIIHKKGNCRLHPYVRVASFGIVKLARGG
ncbi:hypothetical protein [Pseudomonas oryzae]|uniref:Uncharacterized protein n=1 Tax=Pseudomonas oryzae TaxID=1392877 RepID=A0A1H1MN67_9PSED|nr:hypothetical protein [Pseudomonas oryzae]SDR88157.1 hypothetical protein SAMN05216221_0557 [Pseudomonas oryzae]